MVRLPLSCLCGGMLAVLAGCAAKVSPLDNAELNASVEENIATIKMDEEPVNGPISVRAAIVRSMRNNLDHRAKRAEVQLRLAELDLSHYELLPDIAANAGYTARDPQSAASSLNLLTGAQNFGSSTSQDKRIRTSDISIGWNVLDFGLSYVRAKQTADKVLIAEEARRRAAGRLVEEVRTAFWRTYALDRLVSKMRGLHGDVRRQISINRELERNRGTSKIAALTAERELIEYMRTLTGLERELVSARSKLAQLMGLRPGTPFTLSPGNRTTDFERLPHARRALVEIALSERGELRENLYKQRINREEATAALLELLPGVPLTASANTDSNSFLLHNDWKTWGARAGWNLLKVFQYPARRELIDKQDDVLKDQALALTIAIMAQVELSRARLHVIQRDYKLAQAHYSVQERLVSQIRLEKSAGRVSGQTLLRERLQLLVLEARRDMAFADLQNAKANLLSTVGRDPLEYYASDLMAFETVVTVHGDENVLKIRSKNKKMKIAQR